MLRLGATLIGLILTSLNAAMVSAGDYCLYVTLPGATCPGIHDRIPGRTFTPDRLLEVMQKFAQGEDVGNALNDMSAATSPITCFCSKQAKEQFAVKFAAGLPKIARGPVVEERRGWLVQVALSHASPALLVKLDAEVARYKRPPFLLRHMRDVVRDLLHKP
jgi:hypothetical protein